MAVLMGGNLMSSRQIVHVEFPALDIQAGAEFYQKVFGWSCHYMPEFRYATFDAHGVAGGIGEVSEEGYQPGTVVFYVESEDVDADLRRAEELGAAVLIPKMAIPGQGWIAVFTDPEGNRIGLYRQGTDAA